MDSLTSRAITPYSAQDMPLDTRPVGHVAKEGNMEQRDEELERQREVDEERLRQDDGDSIEEPDTHADRDTTDEHETHATTGGAAAAGALTGGVIGLTGGPVGAAIGAIGGAIVGAAAERMMHGEDDTAQAQTGANTSEYSDEPPDAEVPNTDETLETRSTDLGTSRRDTPESGTETKPVERGEPDAR
jgi:hypothetical protein